MDEAVSLKTKKLAEEEVNEEELRELERLSKETLENGILWREAKKELGAKRLKLLLALARIFLAVGADTGVLLLCGLFQVNSEQVC